MNHPDKSTKLLLAVIAVALWLIALNPWLQPPPPVSAQDSDRYLRRIQSSVSSIENSLMQIGNGFCLNGKIC